MLDLDQYRIILESAPNMIWRSGLDAKCDYFNKTWLHFTGRTYEQEFGDGWAEGVHPDDFDRCVKTYLEAFAKQRPFEMNYRLKRYDGEYRIINDRGVPIYLDDGSFAGYVGSCLDVTEKVEGELLREYAVKDGLTGLYNRQYFLNLLEGKTAPSILGNSPPTLLMIDVDRFKKINDKYGHIVGDITLKEVAKTIRTSIGEKDLVGRFGGDEFIVLLYELPLDAAKEAAKNICANVAGVQIDADEKKINVTVSIGLSPYHAGQDLTQWIKKADDAMYDAKRRGGNQVALVKA